MCPHNTALSRKILNFIKISNRHLKLFLKRIGMNMMHFCQKIKHIGSQQCSLAALGSRVRFASGQQVILYSSTCLEVRPRSYVSYFTEKVKPCTPEHHKGIT